MALSDITLADFKGAPLTAVNAMEPSGFWVGLPSAPSGAQSFSVVSPAYFTIATDPDMGPGLVTTGTPIPDNWNGVLVLRQTDPVDGTRDTTFVLTCNSSQGKPTTGLWALTPTLHWLRRKIVADRIAAERTMFYDPGAVFAQTLIANTPAEANTHFNTLAAAADGVSNYRIQCRWDGIMTGLNPVANANFGAGHLRIEAYPGNVPCMQANITVGRNWAGVIFREIGFIGNSISGFCIRFRGSIASGQSYNPRVMFSKCKLGNYLWQSWGASVTLTNISSFILAYFAQEIIIDDECEIDGWSKTVVSGSVRILVATPKYTKRIFGDFHSHYGAYDVNKPNVYGDPNLYVWMNIRLWSMGDNGTNSASADLNHSDVVQSRPNAAGMTACTSYIHFENAFECAGGFTYQKAPTATVWKSPTVQVFMDNSNNPLHTHEISIFNSIFASDAPRGFWVSYGNISLAWTSLPGSDRKPTDPVSPLAFSQQTIGAGGETHIWGSLISGKNISGVPQGCISIRGSHNFHIQKTAHVDFEFSGSGATLPANAMRAAITPFVQAGGDNYWIYPLNYNQNAADFESDLSRQLHHKAANVGITYGARLREKRTVTPAGGAPVTITVTP